MPGYASISYYFSHSYAAIVNLIKEDLLHVQNLLFIRKRFETNPTLSQCHWSHLWFRLGSCYGNPKALSESFTRVLDYIISHGITLIGDFKARDALNEHNSGNPSGIRIDNIIDKHPSLLIDFSDDPTYLPCTISFLGRQNYIMDLCKY